MSRMTTNTAVASLLLAGLLAAPALAQQPSCGPRHIVVEGLLEQYAEAPIGYGVETGRSGGEALMEMFANADSGTWTILVTTSDGTSCIVTFGEGWTPGLLRGGVAL